MPTRHISHQSFDDILSDLGADPAIQDPHGIRKNPAYKAPSPEPVNHPKKEPWAPPVLSNYPLKTSGFILLAIAIGGLSAALFFAFDAMKANSKTDIAGLEAQVLALKNELVVLLDNWELDQEDLYMEMELLEVSIHSNNIKHQNSKPSIKPTTPADELELRRWRYLGSSQLGESQHAFFQTGKGLAMLEKEGQALGDWRVTDIQKDRVTLSGEKGKSIVLKTSRNQ
jgi:hypothetical protein